MNTEISNDLPGNPARDGFSRAFLSPQPDSAMLFRPDTWVRSDFAEPDPGKTDAGLEGKQAMAAVIDDGRAPTRSQNPAADVALPPLVGIQDKQVAFRGGWNIRSLGGGRMRIYHPKLGTIEGTAKDIAQQFSAQAAKRRAPNQERIRRLSELKTRLETLVRRLEFHGDFQEATDARKQLAVVYGSLRDLHGLPASNPDAQPSFAAQRGMVDDQRAGAHETKEHFRWRVRMSGLIANRGTELWSQGIGNQASLEREAGEPFRLLNDHEIQMELAAINSSRTFADEARIEAERQEAVRKRQAFHNAGEAINGAVGKVTSYTTPLSTLPGAHPIVEHFGSTLASGFNPFSRTESLAEAITDPLGTLADTGLQINKIWGRTVDGKPVSVNERIDGLITLFGTAAAVDGVVGKFSLGEVAPADFGAATNRLGQWGVPLGDIETALRKRATTAGQSMSGVLRKAADALRSEGQRIQQAAKEVRNGRRQPGLATAGGPPVGRVKVSPMAESAGHRGGGLPPEDYGNDANGAFRYGSSHTPETTWDDMAQEHRDAVRAYTSAEHDLVNRLLRGDDLGPKEASRAREIVRGIAGAFEHARAIRRDLIVYRGIDLAKMGAIGQQLKVVGSHVRAKGFVSTSMLIRRALRRAPVSPATEGAVLRIHVRKGTKGLYVRWNSEVPEQEEMLFGPLHGYAVQRVGRLEDGRLLIDVRLKNERR